MWVWRTPEYSRLTFTRPRGACRAGGDPDRAARRGEVHRRAAARGPARRRLPGDRRAGRGDGRQAGRRPPQRGRGGGRGRWRGGERRATRGVGAGGGCGGSSPRVGTVSLTRIGVGGERPYQVVVGTGAVGELPSVVGQEARTVAVIHPVGLGQIAEPACRALRDAGYRVHAEQIPDGEAAKDIAVAAGLWSRLAAHPPGRGDAVVGAGGRAPADLAGFTAAPWRRR